MYVTEAQLAAPDGSSLVGFQQSGAAATTDTVSGKLQQSKNLLDALTPAERADALSGDPSIDTTVRINAFLAANPNVEITQGTFLIDHLEIPPTLASLIGRSQALTNFKRKPGASGAMVYLVGGPRITWAHFEGLHFVGSNDSGETCGWDLTGFSYCTFINIKCRNFKQDGWYAKGEITPVSHQMSNNTFANCYGNGNGRDGLHLVGESPLRYENTANVFIGGEFSGNGRWGIYGDVCESTHFYGTCCQGNYASTSAGGGDLWFNSRYCIFLGYIESHAKSVRMGPLSWGCDVKTRSTYPLWNTFIDDGQSNQLSVMGESERECHLFDNVYFGRWTDVAPDNFIPVGAAFSSYSDQGSPFGAGLQLTLNGDFQGATLFLLDAVPLQGQWVTVIFEADTSGVVDPLEIRIYARDGNSANSENGAFVVEPLGISPPGQFRTFSYDIRFPDAISSTPNIAFYPAYGGVVASNLLKLRSMRVVLGQTRKAGWPTIDSARPLSETAASIGNATFGINIHRKHSGKMVFDRTAGKMRFAIGGDPKSAWRASDGSGDLVPT